MVALGLLAASAPILHDAAADRELRTQGFVTIPLLGPAEVAEVRAIYESIRRPEDQGIVIDYRRGDRDLVREVTAHIEAIWAHHLPNVFVDRIQVMSSFVTKFPGEASAVPLHREPTFILPEAGEAYNIWVPLEDVSASAGNGSLRLLPGTEHLADWLAGFNTPHLFAPFDDYLRRRAQAVDVPAGHALVFHARMFHFSPPNAGERPRVAFGAVNVPHDAQLVHVVATGRRGRACYGVDHAFITDMDPSHVLDRIADQYPLLRTVDDDSVIDGAALAAAVGSDEVPIVVPVLPPDLSDDASREPVASEPIFGASLPVADVRVRTQDIVDHGVPSNVASIIDRQGAATLVPLSTPEITRLLPDLRSLARRAPEGAAALVVDAGARITLHAERGSGLDISVYECPQINSGARTSAQVAQLDLGRRTTLRGPGPVLVWNEGPGPVWAVVEPSPAAGWRARWAARRNERTASRG